MKHFNLATKQLANAHGWCVCSNSTQKKKRESEIEREKDLARPIIPQRTSWKAHM